MAQTYRNPTDAEIKERIIPGILPHLGAIRGQELLINQITQYLEKADVVDTKIDNLFDIVTGSALLGQRLTQVQLALDDMDLPPDVRKTISTLMSQSLTTKQRLTMTNSLIAENRLLDEKELIVWSQTMIMQPADLLKLVPQFLTTIGNANIHYRGILEVFDTFKQEPENLLAALILFVQQTEEDDTIKQLRDVIDGVGLFVDEYRIQQLVNLPFVSKNQQLVESLTENIPPPQLVLDRLAVYFGSQSNIDTPAWLTQLLQGDIQSFKKLREAYSSVLKSLSAPTSADQRLQVTFEWTDQRIADTLTLIMDPYLLDDVTTPIDLKQHVITVLNTQGYPFEVDVQSVVIPKAQDELFDNVTQTVSVLYQELSGDPQPGRYVTRDQNALAEINDYLYQVQSSKDNVLITPKNLFDMVQIIFSKDVKIDFQRQALYGLLASSRIVDDDINAFVQDYIANIPRHLTQEEREWVIKALPLPLGDVDIARTAFQAIAHKLDKQLQFIKITPKGLPELRERVRQRFLKARQTPGTMVGPQAAMAEGATVTQLTLNTFHSAGSKLNVASGIGRANELLSVTKNPKSGSCTLIFDSKIDYDAARDIVNTDEKPSPVDTRNLGWTFEEMIAKREQVVGTKISDLIIDSPEIDRYSTVLDTDPWWYNLYTAVYGNAIRKTTWMMRIKLNPLVMYRYHITVRDVVDAITSGTWMEKKKCRQVHGIDLVWSPDGIGIESDVDGVTFPVIDIFPDEDQLSEVIEGVQYTKEQNAFNFLSMIVAPSFNNMYVRGVQGIKAAYPNKYNVLEAVESVIKSDNDRQWILNIKNLVFRQIGIDNTHVARLCWAAGLIVDDVYDDYLTLVVSVPENLPNNPKTVIEMAVAADIEEATDYQELRLKEGIVPSRRPDNELSEAAYYNYLETMGSNLRKLLILSDVDATRSYTNDPLEDYKIFGVESGRNRFMLEMVNVLSQDGDLPINLRHIMLLADFMTVNGELTPLTYTGMTKQPTGVFTKATFEHGVNVMLSAALSGEHEKIESVSSAIIVGQKAKIGTGAVKITMDRDRLRQLAKQVKNQPMDVSNFEQVISQSYVNVGTNPLLHDASIEYENVATIDDDTRFGEIELTGTTITTAPVQASAMPMPMPHPIHLPPELARAINRTEGGVCTLQPPPAVTVSSGGRQMPTQLLNAIPPTNVAPTLATQIRAVQAPPPPRSTVPTSIPPPASRAVIPGPASLVVPGGAPVRSVISGIPSPASVAIGQQQPRVVIPGGGTNVLAAPVVRPTIGRIPLPTSAVTGQPQSTIGIGKLVQDQ